MVRNASCLEVVRALHYGMTIRMESDSSLCVFFSHSCFLELCFPQISRNLSVAVPSFLLHVGVVALLRFPILHTEAVVVSDLFACDAVLLAVNLDDSAATCDHGSQDSCREH
jgi:hypothetical protein